MSPLSLSVVVPVYNGAHFLAETIPAMMAQDLPAEWVFVDDGSTDRTAEVLRDLLDAHRPVGGGSARIIRLGRNGGRAAARDAGVGATSSPIIAFLDSDVAPGPGYLASLTRPLASPDVIATVGRVRTARTDPREPLHHYLNRFPRGGQVESGSTVAPVPWHHLLLGVAAIKREAYQSVGGLKEAVAYGEDLELGARLSRQFPRGLRFVPNAVGAIHEVGTLASHMEKVETFGREGVPVLAARYPTLRGPLRLNVVGPDAPKWVRILTSVGESATVGRIFLVLLAAAPRPLQPALVRVLLARAYARGVRDGFADLLSSSTSIRQSHT